MQQITAFCFLSSLWIGLFNSQVMADTNAIAEAKIVKSHGIAVYGSPKYSANFKRFEYTSSKAKKGGTIRLAGRGTFDCLNEYIAKGKPAEHLKLLYDSLTVAAKDEPFTQYGLLAHTIEYPRDRRWVTFHMRPEARFHDNTPVTADDVVFTFNLLVTQGKPSYKLYQSEVQKVEAIDRHTVKFTFKHAHNLKLPLTIGELPVLPKHFWQDRAFNESSLEIPLGSGPYRVHSVDAGRNITYIRDANYWGKGLPVNTGLYNFQYVSVDYYRDGNVAIEALKAGEYDYRRENSSKFWATAYNIPAIKNKRLIKKAVPHRANNGMQAFVFNLRKSIFQDVELRKAINYAFNFEWSNQTLFYKAYERSYSYFTNSEFAATGLPSEQELKLLAPYKDQLPVSVFSAAFTPPVSDGSGRNRAGLRIAKKILDDANYSVKDNQLYNSNGVPIRFELLIVSPGFERIVNPFIQSLKKLGIIVNVRLIDTSQYINRKRSFSFDMMKHAFIQSDSPGTEQSYLWGSQVANLQGSSNLIGVQNPVIDKLLENIALTKNRQELVTAIRALDRVLLNHHYIIPHWYSPYTRTVYWDKFGIPDISPKYDRYFTTAIFTWWYDEERANKLNQKSRS